jgi:energy-coupling factor transport system permease protein
MHPITWAFWTLTGALVATLTRNPLYLSVLLGTTMINYMSMSRHRSDTRPGTHPEGWHAFLRIVLGLTVFVVPLNALSIHAGSHVLIRLPASWPLIGGNVTLEAMVAGACNALSLSVLLLLFATFNLAVNQAQMLRLTPAFLYEAGLIVSIALTFIPQMMSSAREIREAQRIRGHRMRRARDMLPFTIALLTTGLERSFQLAESLEARGFGNARDSPYANRVPGELVRKALILVGLAGLLSGFFALTYLDAMRTPGWIAVALSTALLVGTFWAQGRHVSRTHYRRDRWTRRDGLALSACLIAAVAVALARAHDATVLLYYPYNQLLPPFHPWLGAALVTLIVPAVGDRSNR